MEQAGVTSNGVWVAFLDIEVINIKLELECTHTNHNFKTTPDVAI